MAERPPGSGPDLGEGSPRTGENQKNDLEDKYKGSRRAAERSRSRVTSEQQDMSVGPGERSRKRTRRGWILVGGAGAVLIALVLLILGEIGLFSLPFSGGDEPPRVAVSTSPSTAQTTIPTTAPTTIPTTVPTTPPTTVPTTAATTVATTATTTNPTTVPTTVPTTAVTTPPTTVTTAAPTTAATAAPPTVTTSAPRKPPAGPVERLSSLKETLLASPDVPLVRQAFDQACLEMVASAAGAYGQGLEDKGHDLLAGLDSVLSPDFVTGYGNTKGITLKVSEAKILAFKQGPKALVIKGHVENSSQEIRDRVLVRAILKDKDHRVVAKSFTLAGRKLAQSDYNKPSAVRFQALLNTRAHPSLILKPGASIPFLFVFSNPPERVKKYSVKVVLAPVRN